MPSLTGIARTPLRLLTEADRLGLDRGELLRAANLRESDLTDPDRRVPLTKIWNLWRMVIDRTDDPDLGINIGKAKLEPPWDLVGYTMYYSRTLEDALNRLGRYSHIVNEALECRVEPGVGHAEVVLRNCPRLEALRHPVDTHLTVLVGAARGLTKVDVIPLHVSFPYPRPVRIGELERFFRCPLKFDESRAAAAFQRSDLERPVVTADESVVGYLEQHAETVLRSLPGKGSFLQRVRRTLWSELSGGPPTFEQIGSLVGVSGRTLQRKLRQEGTSYGAVLDELRHEMAIGLLRDPGLAVFEVAYLLGYRDPSTFYRAFRRWEGATPQQFRVKAS